ncbi:lyase family protein [Amycolatopsis sp. NBC_00345]|uniref:class-II fumarase/aspartase family protein n=1 Tax=Amycolatopsis sp. NBC_00345 TaxID=2975955 RepID=UPI003FA42AF9
MLDAESALARAQARLGTVPAEAAEVITAVARQLGGQTPTAAEIGGQEPAIPTGVSDPASATATERRSPAPTTAGPSTSPSTPTAGLGSPAPTPTAGLGDPAPASPAGVSNPASANPTARSNPAPTNHTGRSNPEPTHAATPPGIDVTALAREARATANPVVGLVKVLAAAVGRVDAAAADHVHRGSTSQDIVDTAMMLVAQRTLRLLADDLDATAHALGELARVHRDTTMPGRTLTAHAVPTTFGLKAATWRQGVLDAASRVRRVLDGGLPVSLGGAAGTLAAYAEYGDGTDDYAERLVNAFVEETGLAAPTLPWHANRTPVADVASVLAMAAVALGKFAVDVLALTRTELGEVTEPAGGGSSAMPHKRNPVLSALIRSAALQVPVLAAGVTQAGLAEDERSAGVWQAEWQLLRECLRLTGGAAHTAVELARGLVVHPNRMAANLEITHGLIVSERLSATLAPLLGKTRAKEVLGDASARAIEENRPLGAVLAESPEITAVLDASKLADLLDPTQYTGAAGRMVDRALEDD